MSVILPTATRPIINATQALNAHVIQWDLVWPEGSEPDPGEILQTVERAEFPNGPWERIGTCPGTQTEFVDLTMDVGHFHKHWYYRVVCQRVRR